VGRAKAAATRAELRLAAAELAVKAGERGMAVMTLRQHLDEEPSHPVVLAALDEIFAAERRQAERIETLGLRAALAGPGERVPLWLERAELQKGLRDLAGARASLRAALAGGDDPRALRALAGVAEEAEAEAALQRLCAIVPDDEEALAGLAVLYERHGRSRELVRVLERQVALAPSSPGPLQALARRLRMAQRWDELADVLARLVRLDDGDDVRGELLDVRARLAEAVEDRDEQRARWAEVAEDALRLQRWVRAVEAYRRVGELLPPGDERADQLYRAGVICRDELGEYEAALECFAAAVASYAGGGEPPATLAEALARLQQARRGGGGRAGSTERASGAESAYHPRTGR
jgi:tetratricopeptide (TPR) repeat protein